VVDYRKIFSTRLEKTRENLYLKDFQSKFVALNKKKGKNEHFIEKLSQLNCLFISVIFVDLED
jgi:hypothetical protein